MDEEDSLQRPLLGNEVISNPQYHQQNGFGQHHQYYQPNSYLGQDCFQFSAQGNNLPELSGNDVECLSTEPPNFIIENAYLPKEIHKKQQRKKQKVTQMVESVQRINCDDVKLNIIFQTTRDCLNWVESVEVTVHNHYKDVKSFVKSSWRNFHKLNTGRLEFSLNDAINNKVFDLPKSSDKEKKKFSFLIKIKYKNISKTLTKETDSFYLIGTDNKRQSSGATNSDEIERQIERTKSDSFNSVSSGDSGVGYSPPSSSSYEGNNNSHQQQHHPQNKILKEYSHIITNQIETKTLSIDGMEFKGQTIHTDRHDIGYHFELGDDDHGHYEEGEVVGLVPIETYDVDVDKRSIQKLGVIKLTNAKAREALLKGVVTKSPYIQAYCPKKDSNKRTIIICMLGIVPVQVVGSVRTSEFLYAAPNRPGVAISEYHLGVAEKKEATFVGVAFSSRLQTGEKSVGLVEAGVSLMQDASQHLVNEKLRDMETSLEYKIERVNKSAIRWRKWFCTMAICFIIFLGLLGVFLWQNYTPGSAYRKWKCRRGHKQPFQSVIMNFIPKAHTDELVETYGIEFEFDALKKKVGHEEYKPIPETVNGLYVGKKPRYMLGFNRCAYGDDQEYETQSGKSIYRGPKSFVVNEKCQFTFFHNDRLKKWQRYWSVDAIKQPTTLVCSPAFSGKVNNATLSNQGYEK